MPDKDLITELQAEIDRLKSELEKARVREKEIEESRRATLFMIEDLNISTSQVERAKKELEQTFDSISDPIFVHDSEFKVIRANKAYMDAAVMKFKEFIDRPYYEIFPKMEWPFKMCLKAQELQEEEEEEEEEEEFSCPITNRIFKIRFYPIKDVNGSYLYSIHILEDITAAKGAEQQIKGEMEITTHLLMIADATANTTDVDKLMKQVVHCCHEIMRCDVCLSYLYDEDSRVFQPCETFGLSHDLIPVFRTEPLDEKMEFVKDAMEGKEPAVISHSPFLHVSDSLAGESEKRRIGEAERMSGGELFSWLTDVNTIAVIPLIGKENYLGIIAGIYKTPKQFTDRDKKVMQGISHEVSTALEQARLYKEMVNKSMELSHKVETIQVMNQIDRSILSTLGADEILETVVRLISKAISCDRVTVGLVDNEKQGFIYKAGFGVTFISKGQFVPFKGTSAAEVVVKQGRIEHISNLTEVKGLLPLEDKFLKDGFLSHIRLPLIVKGEVAAVLSVGSKRPSAWTPEDLSTLEKIASQVGVALENSRLISDLEGLFMGTVKSLSSAIDAKSKWTAGHSERVTKYAVEIAKGMGFDEKALKDIELAGLLHDVGKIGTYETILDKPGKLTDEEVKLIRQHPVKGADILAHIKQLKHIIPAIKYHHEFYDGTGYPEGLKGEEIPLFARILTVADTVDAMGVDRPYRKGRSMEAITAELKRCSGTQFDSKVVEVFLGMKR
ncbi:MAG: HD domain-containing protein [Deltaproteobacteria bacterium]|nr:HD domain-containing protein [Deltaproteobacteria bacterium]